MVWTPKPGAPPMFNLADAFASAISADTQWNWLASFIPGMPSETFDTTTFCALGPYEVEQLGPSNFLTAVQSNPYGSLVAAGFFGGGALKQVAMNRMFAAFCEEPGVVGAETCTQIAGPFTVQADATVIPDRTPIPAGTTHVVLELESGSDGAINSYGFITGVPGGTLIESTARSGGDGVDGPAFAHFHREYAWDSSHFTDGIGSSLSAGTPHDGVWTLWACTSSGAPTDFTPTPQPRPAGIDVPAAGNYPDIAALGLRLDLMTLKLDYLQSVLAWVADQNAVPSGPAGAAAAIVNDSMLDLSGAIGLVVTITTLPPQVDEQFGAPPLFNRLGNVIFDGPDGFGPVVPIDTTPLVVMPIPVGRLRAVIRLTLGATGTVKLIPRAKPLF